MDGGAFSGSGFEGQWGLIVGAPQDRGGGWWETGPPLLEGAHKLSCTPAHRAKAVDFLGAWTRLICWSWRVSCGVGRKVTVDLSGVIKPGGGNIVGCTLLKESTPTLPGGRHIACIISTKTCPHPMTCRLQGWGTSGQRAIRAET